MGHIAFSDALRTKAPTASALTLAIVVFTVFTAVPAGATDHNIEVYAPDQIRNEEVALVSFTTDMPDGSHIVVEELHDEAWEQTPVSVIVEAGGGDLVLEPSADQTYRLWAESGTSEPFTIAVEVGFEDSIQSNDGEGINEDATNERNSVTAKAADGPVEFTIDAPGEITLGNPAVVDFTTSLRDGTRVYVDYRTSGLWKQSSVNTTVSAGAGTVEWTPNSSRDYRLRASDEVSSEFSIDVDSSLDFSAPTSIHYGKPATVSFSTDVADGYRVYVEYLRNGSWIRSSISTTISYGTGTLSWTPNSDRTYRLKVGDTTSSQFEIKVTATFSVTARPVIVYGDRLTASFNTNLPDNSLVTVHYKSDGKWGPSSISTRVKNGKGSVSWTPSGDRAYKLVSDLGSSASFWNKVKPRVNLSAPKRIDRGESLTVHVSTTPKASGKIAVDYRFNGGAWRTSSVEINVVNGKGSATWTPSSTREYRLRSAELGYRTFSVAVGSINTDMLNMALTQSGYEEPSWRNNKYNTWIGGNHAWCSVFVSWTAAQTGYGDVVPQTKTFNGFVTALEAKGVLRSDSTPPGPGAVVLFDWGNANPSHAGFVVSRSGTTLRTVEGNTTDGTGDPQRGVYERTRSTASVWKWFYPSDLL